MINLHFNFISKIQKKEPISFLDVAGGLLPIPLVVGLLSTAYAALSEDRTSTSGCLAEENPSILNSTAHEYLDKTRYSKQTYQQFRLRSLLGFFAFTSGLALTLGL